jgi:O-antigen ligase
VVKTAVAPSTLRASPELPAPARPAVEDAPHRWLMWLCAGYVAAVFLSRWNYLAIAVSAISLVIVLVRVVILRRIDRIGWVALIYLACLTTYGVLVGAAPTLRELPAFLSFEGRIYISFLPLLVIATTKVNRSDLLMVRGLMRVCVIAGAGLLALWMVGFRSFLGNGGNFAGLTSSHHASGFLFAVAALVLLVPSFYQRQRIDVVLGIVALGIVVASGSRTTLVGLLLAGLYLLISSPSRRNRARMMGLIAAGLVLTAVLSGRVASTVRYVGSSAFLEDAAAQFSQPESPETGKSVTIGVAPGASLANILIRFGVWRASLDEFAKSPLLGIGPWRLNDIDRREVGIPGILVLATEGVQVNGSGFGSHNLVLQTAAETGLVGLVLLAAPWILIARRVRRQGVVTRPTLALIAFCVGTLFTSNAMISPALCFPVLIYLMAAARMGPLPDQVLAADEA